MKLINMIIAIAAVIILPSCSYNDIGMLNRAQAVGSPFTKSLTSEYRDFANSLQQSTSSSGDAMHFARKGLATADGVIVMPEVIDDWNLRGGDVADMMLARADLIEMLNKGGRDLAPEKSAIAQSSFDCWIAEQERQSNGASCKQRFLAAMQNLKTAMTPPPAPAPAEAVAAAPPVEEAAEEFPMPVSEASKGALASVQQAMFIVFFDWNKTELSGNANDVLDAIGQELKNRHDVKNITIGGHADTSGSAKYNKALSLKRANAVRDALVSRGVPAAKLRTEGHGEDDLLVKTPDNVREPGNRRAQITLE